MKNKISIESYKNALFQGIHDFEEIEKVLLEKGLTPFLYINTAAGEVRIFMVTLLLYLTGKNPYYSSVFHKEFFISLLQLMHRVCLSSLHTCIEAAFSEILNSKKIEPEQSLIQQSIKLIERIKNKLPRSSKLKITKELEELQKLGGNHARFDDYLETVLKNITFFEDVTKDKKYKKGARAFFRALSIVRNKQSHFIQLLIESEKKDLKNGGLNKMIDEDGGLRMGVRYYKPIFDDIIKFFDRITYIK